LNLENQNYTLALIIGNNLGLNSMLGFRVSFNANYPCRFCLYSKIECNYLVTQDDSKIRNKENYSQGIVIDNLQASTNCVYGTKLMVLMQFTITQLT